MAEDKKNDEQILGATEAQLLQAMGLGLDAPAIQDYTAFGGKALAEGTPKATREAIIEALKTVSDPEIMINIWDLGLVYRIEQLENGDVNIDMTVTAPTCPVAGILPQQAAQAVGALSGVGLVCVKVVWEPAWSPANMSDEAKAMFELF